MTCYRDDDKIARRLSTTNRVARLEANANEEDYLVELIKEMAFRVRARTSPGAPTWTLSP